MSKIKQSFSKFGILLFSFLLMAYSPQEGWSADKSTSSVVKAAEMKNVEAKINRLMKVAEQGDVEVQHYLGWLYNNGWGGIPKDDEKALYWWEKAAQEDADAQFKLGWMYRHGLGVSKDLEKARYWLEKAAEQDHIYAEDKLREDRRDAETQFEFGEEYYYGRGVVSKDLEKAVFSFEKAAEHGHAEAQFRLGWIYYYGDGVPEDLEKAVFWFKKAAENGHINAPHALDNINRIGK